MIALRSSRGLPRTTIILASPVYRGSFTAALKNLLDHLPIEPLAAKPVGIVAMGATSHHYLGMDGTCVTSSRDWGRCSCRPACTLLRRILSTALNDEAKRDLTGLMQALLKLKEISPPARLAARMK